MEDWPMMTSKEILRFAFKQSNMTRKQVADKLQVSVSVINRYLSPDPSYHPGMDKIPDLCIALGNDYLIQWQNFQYQKKEDVYRKDIQTAMIGTSTALKALHSLVEEEKISPFSSEVQEAVEKLRVKCGHLQEALPDNMKRKGRKKKVSSSSDTVSEAR